MQTLSIYLSTNLSRYVYLCISVYMSNSLTRRGKKT